MDRLACAPPPATSAEDAAYLRAVAAQIRQFPDAENMQVLPPIFTYWVERHLTRMAAGTIGVADPRAFIARNIVEAVGRTGLRTVLSIGAGDAAQEILIMRELDLLGCHDVHIGCFDLSETLVRQGAENIARAGMSARISTRQCDVNRDFPDGPVAAVIVVDALHHILDLEVLFGHIGAVIGTGGYFITRDVIGRNGHMRWPEILDPLRQLWPTLPPRIRYNHALRQVDPWFENFDCSVQGFEGIRCQDILGLLIDGFSFVRYLAYGGVVDVFIDRAYGYNLDPEREDDRAFVDSLQAAEDRLIAAGQTKPTQLFAVMRKKSADEDAALQDSARRLVRRPEDHPAAVDFRAAGLVVPYPEEAPPGAPPLLATSRPLRFGVGEVNGRALRWGWLAPDVGHVWSYREDSAISVRVVRRAGRGVTLELVTFGHVIARFGHQVVRVSVNGGVVGTIVHQVRYQPVMTTLFLGDDLLPEGESTLLVHFAPSYSRRPDRDGGRDQRALGFALVSVADVTVRPMSALAGVVHGARVARHWLRRAERFARRKLGLPRG